ncbi:MAG: peptidoglycan-binding protein [Leptolyngbyaceae bacterium]|nr:peptidoglycan-binding protein [Leptolyngbyaceae bacterium]
MEILAFTHLAVDYETPINNHWDGHIRIPSLPNSAWMTVAALTLALSGFATAPSAIALVRQGDMGEEVVALQRSLQNLGYAVGSIDGIFGMGTKNAVIRFQQQHGLTVDGIAGNQTLGKLAELENSRPNTSVPAGANNTQTTGGASTGGASPGAASPVLTLGDSGTAVTNLQTKLKDLGFFPTDVAASGYYGPITVDAVRAFQQSQNLTADGIAGPATQTALVAAQPRVNATVTPTPAPTPAPTPTPAPAASTTGTLQQGDSGELVLALQSKLRQLNYFELPPTGYYGPVTTGSVRAFQQAHGLVVDGIAGPATLNKLNEVSTTAVGEDTVQVSTSNNPSNPARVTENPPSVSDPAPTAAPANDPVTSDPVTSDPVTSDPVTSEPTMVETTTDARVEPPVSASNGSLVTVRATNGLRIRTAPNEQAAIAGLLLDGTSVQVTGEEVGDWLEINPSGWIHQNYVIR